MITVWKHKKSEQLFTIVTHNLETGKPVDILDREFLFEKPENTDDYFEITLPSSEDKPTSYWIILFDEYHKRPKVFLREPEIVSF